MFLRRICTACTPVAQKLLVHDGTAAAPAVRYWEDAVTVDEESALVSQAEKWLAKRRYEPGHFDGVITNYRELQQPLRRFSEANRAVIERVQRVALPDPPPLLPVHILDLGPDAEISRHVDHVEYSGAYIVGLSLLSDAVMRLHHEHQYTGLLNLNACIKEKFLPR